MLLDEDPATLIRHTLSNFNIQPDKHSVSRINDSLSTLAQARSLQLREHKSALQRLQRKHQTLSNHHNELVSSNTATEHATRIADLDTVKFRTAKAASDAEIDCEKLTAHLSDLTSHLQSLEIQGPDGYLDAQSRSAGTSSALAASASHAKLSQQPTTTEQDAAILLQIHIFRNLGVEFAGYTPEGHRKVVVRNEERGEVGCLELDGKAAGSFANFLWGYL